MSQLEQNQVIDAEITDSRWKSVYKVGGAAALIATVLFIIDIIVLTAMGPLPSTANGWFTLLQNNRVVGLFQLFFTDLVGVALIYPIFFALYATLRRANSVYSALATALAFVGIAVYIATNTAYSLISLSDQYAAATTEAQRSQLLAAGEAMLAIGNGTGPNMAGLLLQGALVLISVVMLRSNIFSKVTAYLGILAHGLDLAHFIVFLIFIPIFNSAFASAIGVPLLAIGGTLELIWYPLVARRLFQLGRLERKTLLQPS